LTATAVRDDHRLFTDRVGMPSQGVFHRDRGTLPAVNTISGGREKRAAADAMEPVLQKAQHVGSGG
jgi:hypothetical protein